MGAKVFTCSVLMISDHFFCIGTANYLDWHSGYHGAGLFEHGMLRTFGMEQLSNGIILLRMLQFFSSHHVLFMKFVGRTFMLRGQAIFNSLLHD